MLTKEAIGHLATAQDHLTKALEILLAPATPSTQATIPVAAVHAPSAGQAMLSAVVEEKGATQTLGFVVWHLMTLVHQFYQMSGNMLLKNQVEPYFADFKAKLKSAGIKEPAALDPNALTQ